MLRGRVAIAKGLLWIRDQFAFSHQFGDGLFGVVESFDRPNGRSARDHRHEHALVPFDTEGVTNSGHWIFLFSLFDKLVMARLPQPVIGDRDGPAVV